MNNKLWSVMALFALAGCPADEKGDTATTDTDTDVTDTDTTGTVPLVVDTFEGMCMGDTFHAVATTMNVSNGVAVLNVWETASTNGWNEEHEMLSTGFEAGMWETLETQLTTGAIGDVGDNGDGTGVTLFGCGAGEQYMLAESTLTFAVRVYDADGVLADCASFGQDASVVSGGSYPTAGGAPSNESELANCHEITGVTYPSAM